MSVLPVGFAFAPIWSALDLDRLELDTVAQGLTWEQPTLRLYGRDVAVPRLTCWLGEEAYTYSGRRHEPATMPPVIEAIRDAVERVTGARFNSVLANYYRDGRDSVAEHADDEPELGAEPTIASLSIGAPRTFAIRNRATRERTTLTLSHGDLLVMSGRSQADYLHAIPKTARPVGARLNLTFRQVKTADM